MAFKEILEKELGYSYAEITKYLFSSSNRYYRFQIDKRNGEKRTIYHPAKKLKKYQHFFLKHIFKKLPSSKYVFSYKKGISTKMMLEKHKKQNFTLRIDFSNFFPSIKKSYIRRMLEYYNDKSCFTFKLDENDITLILLGVCRYNSLTIGAITSPQISNVLLRNFDELLHEYCKDINIVYTRYSDDLFFSTNTPNVLKNIPKQLNKILKQEKLELKINISKTFNSSKKHKRTMLGLVLTSNNKISIGLAKKKEIKKQLYEIKQRKEFSSNSQIGGKLAYINSVEPVFFDILKRKYGQDLIYKLMNK